MSKIIQLFWKKLHSSKLCIIWFTYSFYLFFFQVQSKEEENALLQSEMAEARKKHEVSLKKHLNWGKETDLDFILFTLVCPLKV